MIRGQLFNQGMYLTSARVLTRPYYSVDHAQQDLAKNKFNVGLENISILRA